MTIFLSSFFIRTLNKEENVRKETSTKKERMSQSEGRRKEHVRALSSSLPGCSRSSTVPLSRRRSNVRLMQASSSVFLPNSAYNVRLMTTADSNLAINRSVFYSNADRY